MTGKEEFTAFPPSPGSACETARDSSYEADENAWNEEMERYLNNSVIDWASLIDPDLERQEPPKSSESASGQGLATAQEDEVIAHSDDALSSLSPKTTPPLTADDEVETEGSYRLEAEGEVWPRLEDLTLVVDESPAHPDAETKEIEVFASEPPSPPPTIPATPMAFSPPLGGPELAELLATRAELRRLEARCQELEDTRRELGETLARRQADFDNFRRRIERDRDELRLYYVAEVIKQLLPVADNLTRALATSKDNGNSDFHQGVIMIASQLDAVLLNFGLRTIPTVGNLFDPSLHEAVALETTTGCSPGMITQELLRGYLLSDHLLRAALVKVAVQPPD